ncbi:MAG: hypothetical protein PHO18_03625 [Synergistaceae bacterium]|nr:hypothetical protein [Synergistaceae bacterium]
MKTFDLAHDSAVALADCNNFFVSCERRVNSDLDNYPVVVLSSNDGCVISRSNEVKKMGVKMGDPYFKIRDILAFNGAAVRSTNMSLYREISAEVMSRIRVYTDKAEIYSIDEAFFNMGISNIKDAVSYCRMIKKDVWDKCRIPVSIGVAPTKTLCKLAAEYAKKNDETEGVFRMDRMKYMDMDFMSQFACSEIWGIGRKISAKLAQYGIRTSADFIKKDEMWIKKTFGITSLYTSWELKGHQAYFLETADKPPKSIMVSRSFGKPVTAYEEMLDPLLCFTVSAARQLRKAQQMAGKISVFISTSRFDEEKYYANGCEKSFISPTSLDSDLMACAEDLLKEIFMPGYQYKKCGVVLSDFSDISAGRQTTLFSEENEADEKKLRCAYAVDSINREFRRGVIKPAALFDAPEHEKKWAPKSEFKSEEVNKKESQLTGTLRFQSHSEDFVS